MTSYSVIRFKDETNGRITCTESVKLLDNKKFVPKAAKDLPEGNVKVKWQKSLDSGSFSSDGYFEAELLALAGSVKTAEAKAAEMGIKLYPGVLSLSSASSSADANPKKSRRRKGNHTSESMKEERSKSVTNNSELKLRPSMSVKSPSNSCPSSNSQPQPRSISGSKSRSRDQNSKLKKSGSKDSETGTSIKKKRLKLNNVALERTTAQCNLAMSTNPLLQSNESGSTVDDSAVNDHSDIGGSPNLEADSSSEIKGSVNLEADSASVIKGSPNLIVNSLMTEETEENTKSGNESCGVDQECKPPDQQNATGQSDSEEELDETQRLNNSISSMHSASSSSEESDSASGSDTSEDEVSKLSSENEKLKKALRQTKQLLSDSNRDLTLANNLRVAHLRGQEKLTATVESQKREIETLRQKNLNLQDMLSVKFDCKRGNKGSSVKHKDKSLNNSLTDASKRDPVKKEKKLVISSTPFKRETKDSSDLFNFDWDDVQPAYSSPLKSPSTLNSGSESTPKKLKLSDASDSTPKKQKPSDASESTPKKRKPSNASESTPKKRKPLDASESTPKKRKLSDASPASSTRSGSEGNSQKKIKKKKDHDDMTNDVVMAVSDLVLKHLQGTHELQADEKGYVDFGFDIKIDKEALERVLKDSKGDIAKISKGVTALTWTMSQREERSLTGGKNNRFPDAPAKKAATPCKVNACLGVVKAHLMHQGDREGVGMAANLKACRKAIGDKFSQDGAQAKKRDQ